MSECTGKMEVVQLTLEQFEILNKKNCMLEEENRKLKSNIRELQQVIVNMCHERYSHYRPDQDLEDDMKGKKCWKCKYWTKYYNSNQYFCKRGYCKN